jgi:hypothetical protein
VGRDGPDDTSLLRGINLEIGGWEQARDAAAIGKLDGILSSQLLFRRADGSVVGKQEFMAALSGKSPFATRTSRNVVVEVRGDRAISTLIVTTTKEDGSVNHYRNVRCFARADGRWLIEYWFNDDITDLVEIAAAGEQEADRVA